MFSCVSGTAISLPSVSRVFRHRWYFLFSRFFSLSDCDLCRYPPGHSCVVGGGKHFVIASLFLALVPRGQFEVNCPETTDVGWLLGFKMNEWEAQEAVLLVISVLIVFPVVFFPFRVGAMGLKDTFLCEETVGVGKGRLEGRR